MIEKNVENKIPRPPIVVIMGHVDHGKTTLLDYIRKTNIVAREAGGITQSIGAYEIIHNDKKITFIDTPGHEAFSKMRARGAKIADLAILVAAADDNIQPQTKESIQTLNDAKTPFIVAINKIDKPNADVEKIKNDLTSNGVFLEGYGGNISWHAISAKTGEGINELLDLILLAAEMENLTYEPNAQACGIIIEAKSEARRGIAAAIIIKNGILKINDKIATPTANGKIKCLENYLGKKTESLSPSSPALIIGFESIPQIGEEFIAAKEIKPIEGKTEEKISIPKIQQAQIIGQQKKIPTINLILKADVSGSLEPLSEIIRNYKYDSVKIKILAESVGEITDGDVKDAVGSNAIIIGFRAKLNKIAENLAKSQDVKIITSEIIYEILEILQKEIKLKEKPLPQAELEVLKIFSQKGKKQLIGVKVLLGTIRNSIRLKINRAENEIGHGKITGLKKHKDEVNSVSIGEECGVLFESDAVINEKDHLTQ